MSKKTLVPATEVLAEDLEDESFRAEWEETAFARQAALEVVKYRSEHGLSQAALARLLGVSQSRGGKERARRAHSDVIPGDSQSAGACSSSSVTAHDCAGG